MKHQIYRYKIIHEHFLKEATPGKEVTIYAFQESRSTEDWQHLIKEIHHAFTTQGIRPNAAPLSLGEYSIPGTAYFTYRNDSENYTLKNPFRHIKLITEIDSKRREKFNR